MRKPGKTQNDTMVDSCPNISDQMAGRGADPTGNPGISCWETPIDGVNLHGKLPVESCAHTVGAEVWNFERGIKSIGGCLRT